MSRAVNSKTPSPTRDKEKKHRLSRLLGKREKTPEPGPGAGLDSAYGSSEANSANGPHDFIPENERHANDVMHAEKNSEIANIDQDRNLAVKPSTGEVFDEDTGEVVTVVTTTTTTTTTTTMKGGKKQQDVQKDVKREVQSGPGQPPHLSEMPAGPATPEPTNYQPALTATNTTHQGRTPLTSGGMLAAEQPRIPAKSPKRRSGDFQREVARDGYPVDYAPVSPVDPLFVNHDGGTPTASPSRPNFSYPSRSSLKTAEQPQRHNQNTINDLRAAARGLHGVGETLRGTLNSTIDQRFPSKNPEKAARVNAYNDEILERGRTEMEAIPGGWPAHENPEYQPMPVHDSTTMPQETVVPGTAREFSPPVDEKSKGLRKLFKRKPVAEQGMPR
ncbi:hypothetical protein PV04_02772 [Phialophora macrospora]|uniref:Uncharacterized protein n=1 Tax=Phialophora macrospora TaxID=1851006 RepID=A0A0D2FVL5_9EURO|nr:hypothetical protein PV04_02772 [Phialophora macrospora]